MLNSHNIVIPLYDLPSSYDIFQSDQSWSMVMTEVKIFTHSIYIKLCNNFILIMIKLYFSYPHDVKATTKQLIRSFHPS